MAIKQYTKGKNTILNTNFKSTEFDCHGSGCCSTTLIDEQLVNYLQNIRNHFNKPVNISSAYRCITHNKKIGGATGSKHSKGQAADIYINGVSPAEIAKYAESIGILGIGLYETNSDGYFVHIDTRTTKSFWYGQKEARRETFGGKKQTVTPTTNPTDYKPIVCMQTNSTCYKSTRTMTPIGILWHSTGANNPALKRYIQPIESDANYSELIKLIGQNTNRNDYNHASYQSGLNAWIGKLANGTVAAVQTMPWNYRPWGCGSGAKGSCNNGFIQFEICEDNLNDINYFNQIYSEACKLTAYLCKLYNFDPKGYVTCHGIKTPTVLCHADSYKLGLGSNHGDVLHWFNKYGKTMNDVRNDVAALMKEVPASIPTTPTPVIIPIEKEEEEMTQEKFNEMMDNWIAEQANKEPAGWSAEARTWAEAAGLVTGNEKGQKMYKKMLTREELVTVLYRALHRYMV